MLKKINAWFDQRSMVMQILILVGVVYIVRTIGFGLYQVPSGSMETTMLVGERFFADKLSYWFREPKRGEIISFLDPTYSYSENPVIDALERYAWWPSSQSFCGPANWTKRIIGVPGDHVQGKIEDGKPVIYINGQKFDEPYINKYPLLALWKTDVGVQPNWEKVLRNPDLLRYGCDRRSYDPSVPYDKQPFYRMSENMVIKAPFVQSLLQPGAPTSHDVFDVHLGKGQYWVMGDNRMGSSDSRCFGILDQRLIHGRIIYRVFSLDSRDQWLLVDLIKHPVDFFTRIRWSRCLQSVK
jgi:signal peptidase I